MNFHGVTLNGMIRDALKKEMRYKQDVRVSLREYGIIMIKSIRLLFMIRDETLNFTNSRFNRSDFTMYSMTL